MSRVLLGLGSNLEPREENIRSALDLLQEQGAVRVLRKFGHIYSSFSGTKVDPKLINCHALQYILKSQYFSQLLVALILFKSLYKNLIKRDLYIKKPKKFNPLKIKLLKIYREC